MPHLKLLLHIRGDIELIHLLEVMHICVNELGQYWFRYLFPIRNQAIIWTNTGLLSSRPYITKLNEILIKIQNFLFAKMHLEISSAKWWPFGPGGDELIVQHCAWTSIPSNPRPETVPISVYTVRPRHRVVNTRAVSIGIVAEVTLWWIKTGNFQ